MPHLSARTSRSLRRWRRSPQPCCGDYRVLYLIEDGQVPVSITSVTHRADAYRTR